MQHIALEIYAKDSKSSKFAYLKENTSISLRFNNRLFDSNSDFTFPFTINLNGNRHIFGVIADLHSSRLHEEIDGRKAVIYINGCEVFSGYIHCADEVEVDSNGDIDISIEGGRKNFEEIIEGAKANQVPLMGKVRLGVALWRKRWTQVKAEFYAAIRLSGGRIFYSGPLDTDMEKAHDAAKGRIHTTAYKATITMEGENAETPTQWYPSMVFNRGKFVSVEGSGEEQAEEKVEIDDLNTEHPYQEDENGNPLFPFCNIDICYQKYGYESEDVNGFPSTDYNKEPVAQRAYEYAPAERLNSAPNFFVIYWIRCLMSKLGYKIVENQMLEIEDLRRLFFVNTRCSYEEPSKLRTSSSGERKYKQDWTFPPRAENDNDLVPEQQDSMAKQAKVDASYILYDKFDYAKLMPAQDIEKVNIHVKSIEYDFGDNRGNEYLTNNRWFFDAYATSDCFPDIEIKEVISAIENGFGIRFIFNESQKTVRIVLLCNIFRNGEIQNLQCPIVNSHKQENNIRGFRLSYGDSDDTHFYYKGFADVLRHKPEFWPEEKGDHDYSKWDFASDYSSLLSKVSAFNNTCYITPSTGNAYGIKIDKDGKAYKDLRPSLFEYAGFEDAEDGDCSGEEETIKTIEIGFSPAIMNDLNLESEKNGTRQQRFALFVDETMRPRRPDLETGLDYNSSDTPYTVDSLDDPQSLYSKYGPQSSNPMTTKDGVVAPGEFAITSDACFLPEMTPDTLYAYVFINNVARYRLTFSGGLHGSINEGYRLYLQDNYEPNDEGISPIEKHNWGLTLGVLRDGSKRNLTVTTDGDDRDDENMTWDLSDGNRNLSHPDMCDNYGTPWKYVNSLVVSNSREAQTALVDMWADSNINLVYSDAAAEIARDSTNYISVCGLAYIKTLDASQPTVLALFAVETGDGEYSKKLINIPLTQYAESFEGMTKEEAFAYDAGEDGLGILVEYGSSYGRLSTLLALQRKAFRWETGNIVIDNGVLFNYQRLSLKPRAEKPNPYFSPTLPLVVKTKEQASLAMTLLYRTSNSDLLNLTEVSFEQLREAGWQVDENGMTTMYCQIREIRLLNEGPRKILFNCINQDGEVLDQRSFGVYVSLLDNISRADLREKDYQHLILDVDTTPKRMELLTALQQKYYNLKDEDINIEPLRYLEISNKSLQKRGLADKFYSEYSYFIRNARICIITVQMTLAELLAIDMTKRVFIKDISGFIKKIDFTASNTSGLGQVELEIMYI